ncbi:MAG: flavodoxin family protein [Gammaproteobacteria bacterium]
MDALLLNCTLKRSPQPSNTQALAAVVAGALGDEGVRCETIRVADLDLPPGVQTDFGAGDPWPAIHDKLLRARILVIASPTWLGRPSSVAQRVLERMDAMITELRDGRPVAYGRVAGVVVTGNEDGAHHVISEICGALIDIGYTIPPQAWTYWNKGPGPGENYLDTDYRHDWSEKTGRQAARNLAAVARALEGVKLRYG